MGAPIAHPLAGEAVASRQLMAGVHAGLLERFGGEVYEAWLARLVLDGIEAGTAVLSLPAKFLKHWVEGHYGEAVGALFTAADPSVTRVRFVVRTSDRRPAPVRVVPTIPAKVASASVATAALVVPPAPAPEALTGSPLDPRFVFASFLPAPSNERAMAVAQRVAAGLLDFGNPLVITGETGTGKTHLLQAIARTIDADGRRALYVTAERFLYGQMGRTPLSLERLRGIDGLLLDDAHLAVSSRVAQEHLTSLVGALVTAGIPVVLATDRPIGEIDGLQERLRSRLSAGLAMALDTPGLELRAGMLAARLAGAWDEISAEVIAHVAATVRGNGHDMAGAANRLLAFTGQTKTPLSLAEAEVAIRDLVRCRAPNRIRIEDVQKLVAQHYLVSRNDILSSRRTANVVRPRQVAMYLAKILTPRSLPEIGRRFGGRDHTTVLHAVRKIEGLVARDPGLAAEVAQLSTLLEGA